MRLLTLAVLFSIAMMTGGCTDSANELMTQPIETEYVEPIDTLPLIKRKSCVQVVDDYPGEFPPYRIYAPCDATPYIQVDEERYIIVEFEMDGFADTSRVVGFQFNPDEVDILNAVDIIPDEKSQLEALFRMDDDDVVIVRFRFLGTTRQSVGWNDLEPDEIDIAVVLRTNDGDGYYWSPIRIRVQTEVDPVTVTAQNSITGLIVDVWHFEGLPSMVHINIEDGIIFCLLAEDAIQHAWDIDDIGTQVNGTGQPAPDDPTYWDNCILTKE